MKRDADGNFITSISCYDAKRDLNSSLVEWEKNAFANLEELMDRKGDFPCLFGMVAFRKSYMQIAFQESLDNPNSIQAVSQCLTQFSHGLTQTRPKDRYLYETILFVFRTLSSTPNDSNLTAGARTFWTFLEKLHDLDPDSWPVEASKDPNEVDFRYYFCSKMWLPLFFSPHPNLNTRLSKNYMILFQPYDMLGLHYKDNRHYFSIQDKIHCRIENVIQAPVPFYIKNFDKTPLVMQFLGISETNDGSWQCPMSIK